LFAGLWLEQAEYAHGFACFLKYFCCGEEKKAPAPLWLRVAGGKWVGGVTIPVTVGNDFGNGLDFLKVLCIMRLRSMVTVVTTFLRCLFISLYIFSFSFVREELEKSVTAVTALVAQGLALL
jgi:hypothetical protein